MTTDPAPLASPLIVHLSLLGWQPHGCLSIVQDPVCMHGQSCPPHCLTSSQVHLSVKEARFLGSCDIRLADILGRERERTRRACVLESITIFSDYISWSYKRYYFSQHLVLISSDCHDYLFCYCSDFMLRLCGPRTAFLLSAHLHLTSMCDFIYLPVRPEFIGLWE